MKKILFCLSASTMLLSALEAQQPVTQPPVTKVASTDSNKTATPAAPKKQTVADKTKGNKKNEGLFTLYQDTATGSVQMYVRKDQLDKEFIYQSFSINGPVALFLNQSMHRQHLYSRSKKHLINLSSLIVNTGFFYDPKNNPVSKTQDVDKSEAIFYADKVRSKIHWATW
jgi:hypothetical protein